MSFEADYLWCRATGHATVDLFFSSGPDHIREPYSSVMVGAIVEYQVADFAAALDRLPGVVRTHTSEAETWWRWGRDGRSIEIAVDGDNTGEDGVWLGSLLRIDCTFADLVGLWGELLTTRPAVYLHDQSCRMYTPRSFLEEVAMRALAPALSSGNPAVAAEAVRAVRGYRSQGGRPRVWQPYWAEKTPHMAATLFDLPDQVRPIRCRDRWTGNTWVSSIDRFDALAADRGLPYFAHPTGEWAAGRYSAGSVVWVPGDRENLGRELAGSVGMLADG
ncbi:MAG: hypothetical protein K2X87_06605 [Gemmataceae bacterium]|nr:hypothetical protein [Gemmataceae bacterium]